MATSVSSSLSMCVLRSLLRHRILSFRKRRKLLTPLGSIFSCSSESREYGYFEYFSVHYITRPHFEIQYFHTTTEIGHPLPTFFRKKNLPTIRRHRGGNIYRKSPGIRESPIPRRRRGRKKRVRVEEAKNRGESGKRGALTGRKEERPRLKSAFFSILRPTSGPLAPISTIQRPICPAMAFFHDVWTRAPKRVSSYKQKK